MVADQVGEHRQRPYFNLVVVRDLFRFGAWTFGVAGIPGATVLVWIYCDIRTWYGAEIGAERLGIVAGVFVSCGLLMRHAFRRGMTTVGDVPPPAPIREGWRAVPGVWYGVALLWLIDGTIDLARRAMGFRRASHVQTLSVQLHAAFSYGSVLMPALVCLLLARAHRAARQREDRDDVVLLGGFEPILGLGMDRRAQTSKTAIRKYSLFQLRADTRREWSG